MYGFTKREVQMRKLEKSFQKQVELLAEMAAAYVAEGKPVPPEVGEALGEVEHRRREFQNIKKIYTEHTSGIGVKPIVQRFLERTKGAQEAMKRLLALHEGGGHDCDQSGTE